MELYLPECVDSLLAQNLESSQYEVIIVNDESKDRTLEIAREYESNYSNVKVIDKKNAGVGAARNSGYDLAQGEYIYFLDPDDYLAQDTLPVLLSKMDQLQLDILSFRTKSVYEKKYPVFDNLISYAIKYFNDVIKLKKQYKKPNKDEKKALEALIKALENCNDKMTPEDIQTQIYSVGKDNGYKENLRDWFKLIYQVVFGVENGPRMGFFISFFGVNETKQLIRNKLK